LKNRVAGLGSYIYFFSINKRVIASLLFPVPFIIISGIESFIKSDPFMMVGPRFIEPLKEGFIMGTDDLGRDIFRMVLAGTKVSLIIGLSTAITSLFIGIMVGSISGFYGGRVDDILMRITEIFQTIPRFFLALVIVTFFGSNMWNIVLVLGILSWPDIARITRAEFLSLKERPFVEAARAIGERNRNLIFNEILPNALPPIITSTVLLVSRAIVLEAGLSFMGLGDPNIVSLGYLLYNAQSFYTRAWWMAFFPGIVILLISLSFIVCGDALNEVLNPRVKEAQGG
jgi:peptide/nickel transport system permease protein